MKVLEDSSGAQYSVKINKQQQEKKKKTLIFLRLTKQIFVMIFLL